MPGVMAGVRCPGVWRVHLCGPRGMGAPGSEMKPAHTAWSRMKERSDATELPDVWPSRGMNVAVYPQHINGPCVNGS